MPRPAHLPGRRQAAPGLVDDEIVCRLDGKNLASPLKFLAIDQSQAMQTTLPNARLIARRRDVPISRRFGSLSIVGRTAPRARD